MLSSFTPFANALGLPDETFGAATSGAGANAIEKSLMILLLLVRQDRPLGTVQISRMTGFHKATTSRILMTLERFGLVVQNDRTRKYLIGPLGYQMGATQLNQSMRNIAQHLFPRLIQLRDHFGQTICLELWAGRHSIVAAVARASDKSLCDIALGDARPLYNSAGGMAVLAQMDPARAEKYIPSLGQSGTDAALPPSMCISKELASIRAKGYVCHVSTEEKPQMQLAVALMGPEATPLGAISVLQYAGPDQHKALQASVATLAQVARRMMEDLRDIPICPLEIWHHDHG